VDEKWIYITEADKTLYLAPGEEPPHRTVQSKRFITKVMFMGAMMRPIHTSDGLLLFDGKLGMWPFTERVLPRSHLEIGLLGRCKRAL
uniref:Uncharacterized protein n=1 Tax=Phytophthora ramorum TaxID=164328 RepID=H3G6I9_PHYRM